ncbi:MAG: hypothetical protein CSA97_02785 [Bacteroidetes bacterium]|nr:MAG: hypothetical protein CSA97_02785 [Bacteroidota bacterium]
MRSVLLLLLLASLSLLSFPLQARTLCVPYVVPSDSIDAVDSVSEVSNEGFLKPVPARPVNSFSFGLSLGLSAAQLDGDGYGGYHHLWPSGGFFVRYHLPKNWDARLGFSYVCKGARGHAKRLDAERTVHKVTFHYLELPLVFEYLLKGRFQFSFGMGFGYLMSASQRHFEGEVELSGVRKPAKIEWTAQASFAYFFTEHWAARLGGSYSILPVRGRPSGISSPIRTGQYNNVLLLNVEYLF